MVYWEDLLRPGDNRTGNWRTKTRCRTDRRVSAKEPTHSAGQRYGYTVDTMYLITGKLISESV